MTRRDEPADRMAAVARMSLQELENDDWGDPEPDDTGLVKRCMWLRRKPLGEFDDADLGDLIMQRISLPTLVPIALGMLLVDPWLEAALYPGALLATVAGVKDEYWQAHPDQAAELEGTVAKVIGLLDDDPLCVPQDDGDGAPGRALMGVMRVPGRYWQAHPVQLSAMREVVARAKAAGYFRERASSMVSAGLSEYDVWESVDPIFAPGGSGLPC